MEFFKSDEFGRRVRELADKHHIPGFAAAIVQDDTIASAGFGKASINPPRDCTAETLFDAASTSKSFTAASAALLIDESEKYRNIKWDTPVSTLLPDDFVLPDPADTATATVEDILSHRSGMAPHDFSYLSPRAEKPDDAKSLTRNLRNLESASPIRSKYMYCNMMYTATTYLVEELSGLPFAEFLEKRFFEPLEMTSTNLQPSRAKERGLGDRFATGYAWDQKTESYNDMQCMDGPEAQGAGSIITSANDYIKWVKALMHQELPINKDIYHGIVRPRTLKSVDTENLPSRCSPEIYGVGISTYYYRGYAVTSHAGGVPGFGSYIFFLPQFKFGGVIFSNSMDGQMVAMTLARELIDELLNVPTEERPDWDKILLQSKPDSEDKDEPSVGDKSSPGKTQPQPQVFPLDLYTGNYEHPGYHRMTVEVREGKLYIDASERSLGFTLTFDHVCEQRKFLATIALCEELGSINGGPIKAEFRMEKERFLMGLDLEPKLGRLIWFERELGELSTRQLRELWQK